MKKKFISPAIMVVNMQVINMLAISQAKSNVSLGWGGEGDVGDEAQIGYRNGWGSDEEENTDRYKW